MISVFRVGRTLMSAAFEVDFPVLDIPRWRSDRDFD